MNYEKIVTLFDTAQHAEAAKRNLESAGFPPAEISTINNRILAGDKLHEPGLWRRLFGRDVQNYEAIVFGRSVENGGVVLTVRVPDADVARATRILNAHEAVDLQARAQQQGLLPKSDGAPSAKAPPAQGRPATPPPPVAMAAGKALPEEEILRLAEEQMDIGKRIVDEGTTRIRRYVTETPVEAQVTLHEEHARIIRRTSTGKDPMAREIDWSDKTIEFSDTTEEPVITKSVHITEEVVIRRESTDTVRTLKDKVRRQQVDVEKLPGRGPADPKK